MKRVMPEILENKNDWQDHFRRNWLGELEQQGVTNWKIYRHPRNETVPGAPGIELRKSQLLTISSAGAYLRGAQEPFDEHNLYGDYSLRTFPATTPFHALDYAHGHYDTTMIRQDAQVAIPLRHLEVLVAAGKLGRLAPLVVSFMGYQPDSAKVVDEVIPKVVAIAKEQAVHAALLAPV